MEIAEIAGLLRPQPVHALVAGRVALVDIDVQNAQVFGLADKVRGAGLHAVVDGYDLAVAKILPKIRALKDRCRAAGIEVIHLRCASYTGDGNDCSRLFRSVDISASDGDEDAEIHAAVAPEGDEIVLSKVSAGAFNGSDLDFLLTRLGIDTLIVTGLVTAGCVEGTVRGSADRGYKVLLVEDACADWTAQHHDIAMRILGRWFATLIDTITALGLIDALAGKNDGRPRDPRQASSGQSQPSLATVAS